jgi:quercetin dioxygenase-like cupin family protein
MAAPLLDGTHAEFVDLLETCPVVPGATVSKPLLNRAEGRVVLFAMDAGQVISEHRAPFLATVQVLDGRLRFGIGGREREMAAHDWLLIPPDAPHSLEAIEATRFVLTLFKKG